MPALGPRLVIAGTHSGVGKTTVATGLMAALRRRGLTVASAKVGPDFIDPGYHTVATGRPGRNLDAWICGEAAIAPLAGRAAAGADLLIVEGVMGLFDGAADAGTPPGTASTAHVATLLDSPVVLVVDAAAMSASVAAVVHGYATLDPRLRLGGVILNRVGSDGHETMLREALAAAPTMPPVPVLGVLRRDEAFTWRDRHLGLVPVAEQPEEVRRSVERVAAAVERGCDLDALLALAATAPGRTVAEVALPIRSTPPAAEVPVAVAGGPAFTFVYQDNLEALAAAGATSVSFDPRRDPALPEGVLALYVGGGFPEVFAADLAANEPLLADVRRRVGAGLVTWAECGGLLWLAGSLDGHRLAGVLATEATMTSRLTLGYRRATTRAPSPLGPAGTTLRGHEFHYSTCSPPGEALQLSGRFGQGRGGFASPTLLASYLHVHLGGAPEPAERFVSLAASAAAVR